MQNDFMPGGSLGVPEADKIIPILNHLIPQFSLVLATQDWHPANHQSFAKNHPGQKVGDIVMVKGVEQILWPEHCVRNTKGAELAPSLAKDAIETIFYKGTDEWIDSYSAFFDNARQKSTGLGDYLESRNIKEIYIAGVATDYCVLYSVNDALDLGFKVNVIEDCCKPINLQPEDEIEALASMKEKGAQIINSTDVK
jgi:nicotinamidase/pyrazinamidase